MEYSEFETLEALHSNAQEAVTLFSSQEKQEKTIVAGLLLALDSDFHKHELIKFSNEPIDIIFRDARFQVTEILNPGRKRNREIKDKLARITNAKNLVDLVSSGIISSQPLSPYELYTLAFDRCGQKADKYGKYNNIDLLIYVNLPGHHLYPLGPFPKEMTGEVVNWRSVSVIMEPYTIVLWANDAAPEFIVKYRGQVVFWPKLESVFPKLG